MFLLRFEQELQRILGNPNFGLPYWDWAEDGELPRVDQWRTRLWTRDYLGEARGRTRSGRLADLEVRLVQDAVTGALASVSPREIERAAGLSGLAPNLPDQADVQIARDQDRYDQEPWSQAAGGHRNRLEGWIDGPQLHNRVHVWIGGDMIPGTSPNDPAFFLNHCNVDRIWEEWMARHGRTYAPVRNRGPRGHRIDSTMVAILGDALTPSNVLDPSPWYSYDTLHVA